MRFVFRADASTSIGTGHVMRSIGIIQELVFRKFPVIFVGDISEVNWLHDVIKSVGFSDIHILEKHFKSNKKTDILILDSYQIPKNNEFINKNNWKLIVVVADPSTPNYEADIRIYPNFYKNGYGDNLGTILSGSEYIPLRKSIKKIKLDSKLNIAVTGGGIDFHDFATAISFELAKIPGDFNVNVFTNNSKFQINDNRFKTLEIGNKIDYIANDCNLAFTTSGTSSVEFISRGCAVGMGCSAENQRFYYNEFSKLGIAKQVGRLKNGEWYFIKKNIIELVNSRQLRQEISTRGANLIDLDGAKRIVDKILLA